MQIGKELIVAIAGLSPEAAFQVVSECEWRDMKIGPDLARPTGFSC
jgi:hypothetical protein